MARYQPALLGGLFIGVLSSLPVIGAFNVCCCLWVVTGGVLTTYLMQQNDPLPIETSTAALAGLFAGAIGGVISAIGAAIMMAFVGDTQREAVEQMLGSMRDLPPEAVAMIERFTTGPAMAIIGGVITVPIYGIFGLLGALLGVAFFRKKPGPTEAA